MNRTENGMGRLMLKQFGHARVVLDGRFAGYADEMDTSERALPVPEGEHAITVVPSGGGAPRVLQVRVWAGAAALVLPGLVMTVRS